MKKLQKGISPLFRYANNVQNQMINIFKYLMKGILINFLK